MHPRSILTVWGVTLHVLFLPGDLAGKGDEQRAAASLACLLCIQLGSGIESEEVFKTLKPVFKNILADGSANIQARQAVSDTELFISLVIWTLFAFKLQIPFFFSF